MSIPYVRSAIRGYCKSTAVQLSTQSISGFLTTETLTPLTIRANFQPMPKTQVDRKPLEQRTWVWWTILVEMRTAINTATNTVIPTPRMNIDDIVVRNGQSFRIQSITDWEESGYVMYEAIEDFVST